MAILMNPQPYPQPRLRQRTSTTMSYHATHRGLPADYFDRPLIRSYVETGPDHNLYRIEVRGEENGLKVQARFPLPSRMGGPSVHHGARSLSS